MSISQKCKIDGCNRRGQLAKNGKRYMVKGLCSAHYTRHSRNTCLTSKTSFDARPAVIECGVAKIPIGIDAKGGYALVDINDRWVDKYKWCLSRGYAVSHIEGKLTRLHRLLLGAEDSKQVDHINRNRLDNRRNNLRLVTNQQNAFNKISTSRSGYKGVTKNTGCINSWAARITHNGKGIYLGSFATAELAAQEYNKASLEFFGEYGLINK